MIIIVCYCPAVLHHRDELDRDVIRKAGNDHRHRLDDLKGGKGGASSSSSVPLY